MPVMEGKAALFKRFGGIDAWPLCLDTQDTDEIVAVVKAIAPGFAGINLEDISAPRCFEIEARLREQLDIPVFHDDQHGTAIVVLAALYNALRVVEKDITKIRVVLSGAGAAGTAILKLLLAAGVGHVVVADIDGIVSRTRPGISGQLQVVGGEHQPGQPGVLAEGGAGRGRCVHRGVGPAGDRRGRGGDDGGSGDRVRVGQSGAGDRPGRGDAARRGGGHRTQSTSRTRSTTCSPSPGCSVGCWMPARPTSPRRC